MQIEQINIPKVFQPYQCNNLIRLGRDYDGGYLVNRDDLEKTDLLLGFGILDDYSFESDFVSLRGCRSRTYDASSKKFKINDDHKHYLKFVTEYGQNDTVALSEILKKSSGNTFIKCDIEGGEYQLLDTIVDFAPNLTGFVVEFHDVDNLSNFFNIVNFISKFDLKLVHTHINNCSGITPMADIYIPQVIELTFSSSNNISLDRSIAAPHHLDMPNESHRTDYSVIYS